MNLSCLQFHHFPRVSNALEGDGQLHGGESRLYDTCESKPHGKGRDDQNDAGVPSASEAKQLWLEREVQSLKHALDRVAVPQSVQQSEYWVKGGFENRPQPGPTALPAGATTSIAHGLDERHLLGGCGTDRLQHRAEQSTAHWGGDRHLRGGCGPECLQDRAQQGIAHGQEDRNLLGGGGLDALQARALQFSSSASLLPPGDRAEQIFGSAPGVPHGDRASNGAASQHHGGPLRHPLGEGRGHGQSTYGPIHGGWTDGGGGNSGGSKAELPELPSTATPLEYGD